MSDDTFTVEVAYALPDKQALLEVRVPRGTTALEAAQLSGIASKFTGVDLENATLGIFGQIVAPGHSLRDGDRVEIYRPLIADPKDVRKARAERAKARKGAR
jgi:putative ubiquitin-RnfH superfamily antitoxin RatB of RatAB toxin-antitoxin module